MKLILPNEKPMSLNELYSGKHWSFRQAEVLRVRYLVMSYLPRERKKFLNPVDIKITSYCKSHPLDPDNICEKLYIDALKGLVLIDDNNKYVNSVYKQSIVDKKNTRLEIELNEV